MTVAANEYENTSTKGIITKKAEMGRKTSVYVSGGEIRNLSVILAAATLLKNKDELESKLVQGDGVTEINIQVDNDGNKTSKMQKRVEEFMALSNEIAEHYGPNQKAFERAMSRSARIIQKLFDNGRLYKYGFTIEGLAFMVIFVWFCKTEGGEGGRRADNDMYGKLKNPSFYDDVFEFTHENDHVSFLNESEICSRALDIV